MWSVEAAGGYRTLLKTCSLFLTTINRDALKAVQETRLPNMTASKTRKDVVKFQLNLLLDGWNYLKTLWQLMTRTAREDLSVSRTRWWELRTYIWLYDLMLSLQAWTFRQAEVHTHSPRKNIEFWMIKTESGNLQLYPWSTMLLQTYVCCVHFYCQNIKSRLLNWPLSL